jgi:Tfp pilus assembly protein PilF
LATKKKTIREKDVVYREGIEHFPNSPELLGNYALFLKNEKNDMEGADKYFLKALEVDPNKVNILQNYAIFLRDVKKDENAAHDYFSQAHDAKPYRSGLKSLALAAPIISPVWGSLISASLIGISKIRKSINDDPDQEIRDSA